MRVAVVGHVEWVTFARVDHVPVAGEIVHAQSAWSEPAGGGGVAAVQLALLAGSSVLFTALGAGPLGERIPAELAKRQVEVFAARRETPQPEAFTFLDAQRERTITVLNRGGRALGDDALPWEKLAQMDALYFVSGDADALRLARRARVLVATARVLKTIEESGVELDALVHSAADAGERYVPGMLTREPRVVVSTEGSRGGTYSGGHRYEAVPLPGTLQDAYGAGDSFAAGLTFGLGQGLPLVEALSVASRCGAEAVCRAGAFGGR